MNEDSVQDEDEIRQQLIAELEKFCHRIEEGEKSEAECNEEEAKLRSMALIHENLLQSKSLVKIDFARYIKTLAVHLFHSYRVDMNRVGLKVDAKCIFLEIDAVISLGLIVNELVSNSLKHAFPDGREGEIRIRFLRNKKRKFLLEVSDNGAGIPEGLDIHKTKTLGMRLVRALTKQIEGTIEFGQKKEGITVRISF
jgi:two-component sensor histidine kinase